MTSLVMVNWTSLLIFLFSASVFSQEVEVKVISVSKHKNFQVGIGSKVELQFPGRDVVRDALFLGRMVDQDLKDLEFLFLDQKLNRVYMVNPENLRGIRKSRTQAIISPIDQMGSTCTAYGFFHFWNQTFVSKLESKEELSEVMSSDRRRMQYLEEIIDIYYIQNRTNITTLLKRDGERFGFKCKNNLFKDSRQAADFVFLKASEGFPVMIDFNIASRMVTSTYELTDYESPLSRDSRLWIPRKVGQRITSGHVIVVAGAFVSRGRQKLLVLDSNWVEPRIWDVERYLKRKAAVKEMGFHTCVSSTDL
jgi:hypothetical protein